MLPDFEFSVDALIARRYVVRRPLGRGGMGEVYHVTDLATGQDVALKTISLRDEKGLPRPWQMLAPRFQLEARICAQLRDTKSLHDGRDRILTVLHYDFMEDGRPFALMELLEGWTLGEYLKAHKRLPFSTACRIVRDVCLALAFLHENGVIHRDVKPNNVFLEPGAQMRARLMDLGVATYSSTPDAPVNPDVKLTAEGGLVGTHGYIPRQAYFGEDNTSARDMYALGVLIFETVTGQSPWAKYGWQALREILLRDNPPIAPLLTEHIPNHGEAEYHFACQVRRLLSHDPDQRPDAATMAVACERADRAVAQRQAPVEIDATIEDDSAALTSTMQRRHHRADSDEAQLPSIIVEGSDPALSASGARSNSSELRQALEVATTTPATHLPGQTGRGQTAPLRKHLGARGPAQKLPGGQTPAPVSRTVGRAENEPSEEYWSRTEETLDEREPEEGGPDQKYSRAARLWRTTTRVVFAMCAIALAAVAALIADRFHPLRSSASAPSLQPIDPTPVAPPESQPTPAPAAPDPAPVSPVVERPEAGPPVSKLALPDVPKNDAPPSRAAESPSANTIATPAPRPNASQRRPRNQPIRPEDIKSGL